MLSPDKANPQHMFEDLPLDLEDISQVEKLPLLNPPPEQEEEKHIPLIRREWTTREKGLALACGFAAVTSLWHMAQGETQTILDELHGQSEAAVVRVDTEHQQGDILSTPIVTSHTTQSSHSKAHSDHDKKNDAAPIEAPRELNEDWTDLALELEKEPTPMKPTDLPRFKLPFPITESTPPSKHLTRE